MGRRRAAMGRGRCGGKGGRVRGVTALVAAAAMWVLVTGVLPSWPIRRSTLRIDPSSVALAAAGLVIGASIAYAVLGVPIVAAAIGALAGLVPVTISRHRAEQAAAATREAWPDLLAHTRTGISAGNTLHDALATALDQSEAAPGWMGDVVRREVAFGSGLDAALEEIAMSEADPTTDRVVTTLQSASGTGGARVGEIVSVLGRSVAEELRLRKAHDAALTEHRWTVNVALIAPWVLLALSVATHPQSAAAFSTPTGVVVVVVGLVLTGCGWVLARRAARLSQPPRVFR